MAAILTGLLLAALASCTSSGRPEAIADPRRSTSTTPASVPDEGGDEVVWQEFTRGGFVPTLDAARQVPAVTIYADGRIFTTVHDPEDRPGPPVALEQAQIPEGDLDAFLADAQASGLFEPGIDFGSPSVTDQPSTMVLVKTGDAPQQIDVYALDFSYELPVGDVTSEQSDRRERLRSLLVRAEKLGEAGEAYVPARVRAVRFDPSVVITPPASSPAWPGPPLSSFPPFDETTGESCLVIEGGDAAAVYQADQQNPETTWKVDGSTQPILIVPLLPGQEGCPPS